MARKRPTRRRQPLEIEPLNWVAPELNAEQDEENVEQERGAKADKKVSKN